METLYLVAAVVVGLVTGALGVLKVVAPVTKTASDDELEKILEEAATVVNPENLQKLRDSLGLAPKADPAPASQPK